MKQSRKNLREFPKKIHKECLSQLVLIAGGIWDMGKCTMKLKRNLPKKDPQ